MASRFAGKEEASQRRKEAADVEIFVAHTELLIIIALQKQGGVVKALGQL